MGASSPDADPTAVLCSTLESFGAFNRPIVLPLGLRTAFNRPISRNSAAEISFYEFSGNGITIYKSLCQ